RAQEDHGCVRAQGFPERLSVIDPSPAGRWCPEGAGEGTDHARSNLRQHCNSNRFRTLIRRFAPPYSRREKEGKNPRVRLYLAVHRQQRNTVMSIDQMEAVAQAMVAPGKGIIAIDESSGTIKKRFDAVGVPDSEENRRAYREMLLTAPGLSQHISGAILYEETIRQSTKAG